MSTRLAAFAALGLSFALFAPACAPGGELEDEELVDGEEEALGNALDLAAYILPSCGGDSPANAIGSEKFYTKPIGVKNGRGHFLVMKSQDGDGFEEWAVDANYFYIRLDTTWAYELPNGEWCDTQCGNSGQYACRRRWANEPGDYAYTVYHAPGDASQPARWLPRKMTLAYGEEKSFTAQMGIQAARRADCSECSSNFASPSVPRTVAIKRLQSWQGFSDVLQVRVTGGPGAGERYFYGRGRGWIGFNDRVANAATVPGTAQPQWSCNGFATAGICSVTGATGGGGGAGGGGSATKLPDIVVDSVTWSPATPKAGDPVKFVAKLRNQGNASTGKEVGVGFTVNGQGGPNWWFVAPAFAAGEARTLTMSGTWSAVNGAHVIRAHADDINRFAESNESNNTREATLQVGSGGGGGGGGTGICACRPEYDNVCFYPEADRVACGWPKAGCSSDAEWTSGWHEHADLCD